MAMAKQEQDPLQIVLEAADARDAARHALRQDVLKERERLASGMQSSRTTLGQRLLSAAGIEGAELDAFQREEEAKVRSLVEKDQRAVSILAKKPGLDRTLRPARRSPFPAAPQAGYKLVQLDTATFIGPAVDQTGSNSRNLVVPAAPAPGRNLSRAFVALSSGHQSGFDPGHIDWVTVNFFFMFTPQEDILMNAVSFADWRGGYTNLAGWYPFDNSWAEATFTMGMDAFVVNPQGQLVGMASATPDQGFDKRIDVGPFDFVGAYDSFTYDSNSALFVYGIGVPAKNSVFLRVWAELDVNTKSVAYSQVDFASEDRAIDVTGVFAATFPPIG